MAAHLLTGEPSHTDHRKSLSRLTDSYRAQNSNDELLSGDKCPRKISFGKINGQDKTGLNIASVKTSGLCKDGQILSKESADNPDKIYSECEKNSDYQERAFDSQGNTCGRGASNMKIKCQKENGFVSRPDVERCIVCLKLKNTKRKIRSKCRKEKRSKTSRNMPYSGGFITESPDCSVTDLRSTYSSDNNSEAYSYRRSVSTLGITREYENVMMKTSAESVYFVLPELNMNSSVIEDKAPAVHVSTDKVLFTDTGSEGKVSVLETVDQSSLYEVQLEDDCKMDSRPGIVSSEANEDLIESKVLEQDIITLERDSVALGAKINRKASSSCKFDSSPSRSVCLEVTSCSCSTASISGSDSNIHCRICHCGEEDEVLICPCGCSGSLAHVHQSCLITWMKNSMTEHCELCQRKIRVIKKIKPCYKVSVLQFYYYRCNGVSLAL